MSELSLSDEPLPEGAPPRRSTRDAMAVGAQDTGEHRVLDGRSACLDALREAITLAADEGCRTMYWCDADFADWPIGEKAVVEALTRWAQAHRRLTVLAANFERFHERFPRWVQFRRQWAHVVECRSHESLEPAQWPGLLLAPGLVTVRVLDRRWQRGSWSRRRDDELAAREWIDATAQQSGDAFPATTLGL